MMGQLFDVEVNTINYHLKEIFKSGELDSISVIRKIRITALDGKNYLNADELYMLNRIVTMYLDYADMQAENYCVMYMKDWIEKLNAFLKFNEKDILQDLGKVSHEVAANLAENQFKKFKKIQDKIYLSDFDKVIKKISLRSSQTNAGRNEKCGGIEK